MENTCKSFTRNFEVSMFAKQGEIVHPKVLLIRNQFGYPLSPRVTVKDKEQPSHGILIKHII